ncbi:MAG: hypothetical protein PHY36_05330 [Methanocellales archaeon]|nr:hypothetical protein [Methanocellales archaeon]MDD5447287.1 hypothetical protein [Methanocellales archaeon]
MHPPITSIEAPFIRTKVPFDLAGSPNKFSKKSNQGISKIPLRYLLFKKEEISEVEDETED